MSLTHSTVFIPVATPIHKACAPDAGRRFSFQDAAAYVTAESKCLLAATDGRMAAYVPFLTHDPKDRGADADAIRLIPAAALKALKRRAKGPVPVVHMNGTASIPGGASFPLSDMETFPPMADVLPNAAKLKDTVVVTLNPELLARLAEALGSANSVTIVADREGKNPLVVIPGEEAPCDAVGLLMPLAFAKGRDDRAEALRRTANARAIIEETETRKRRAGK
jgi:hypothetical protein